MKQELAKSVYFTYTFYYMLFYTFAYFRWKYCTFNTLYHSFRTFFCFSLVFLEFLLNLV